MKKSLRAKIFASGKPALLTIVNLVLKMYRNGMLSAETEVRNGIL